MGRNRRRIRSLVAISAAVSVISTSLVIAPSVEAEYRGDGYWVQDNWDRHKNTQDNECYCVPATTLHWLEYIPGANIPSSQDIINEELSSPDDVSLRKDKYDWTDPDLDDCHGPVGAYGHDPRGEARELYDRTPGGYYFQDYAWAGETTGRTHANLEIVRGLRSTNAPVTAIIYRGTHAVHVTGYRTNYDPLVNNGGTLVMVGFYWVDPLDDTTPPTQHYTLYSNWVTHYFLPNTTANDGYDGAGPYWGARRIIVTRKYPVGIPSSYLPNEDNAPLSYGDWFYNQNNYPRTLSVGTASVSSPEVGGVAFTTTAIKPQTAVGASTPTGRSIPDAIDAGLQLARSPRDTVLGLDLAGYEIGRVAHVDALDPRIPSYELVELRVAGSVAALATVIDVPGGFQLGSLRPATVGATSVIDPENRATMLERLSITGSSRLVWGWTREALSPFRPFVQVTDAVGRTTYVDAAGSGATLHLVEG